MEKVILGCRCNNKEELKKCLELLQKHGITWAGDSKIKPDADSDKFYITDSVSIFLHKSTFQKKKFEITFSFTIIDYGYTNFSNCSYFIVNLAAFTKYLQYYEKWKILY